MKKKILVTLLTLCAILSLLSATVLAAGDQATSNDFYNMRSKYWLYEATANMESTEYETSTGEQVEKVAKDTNIRDKKPHEEGIMPTQLYDLGSIQYGAELGEDNKLVLTFTNKTGTEKFADQGTQHNKWGVMHLTTGTSTESFDLKWSEGTVYPYGCYVEAEGGEATLTVTPKNNLAPGEYTDNIIVMDQESRVGWVVKVKVEVKYIEKTINLSGTEVTKYYGQTLTPADVTVNIEGVNKTLAQLGVEKIMGDGAEATATAGNKTYTISCDTKTYTWGNYKITFNEEAKVKVNKAVPKRVNVSATSIKDDEPLQQSQLSGKYVNPYDPSMVVEGEYEWHENDTSVEEGKEYGYTFTPKDTVNYETLDNETAIVGFTTEGGTVMPIINVTETQFTYNGEQQQVEYTVNDNVPPDWVNHKWRLKDSTDEFVNDDSWPTNAGDYEVVISTIGGVSPGESEHYAPSSTTVIEHIAPKTVNMNFTVYSHYYDGGTSVQLASATYNKNDICAADSGKVALMVGGNEMNPDNINLNAGLLKYFKADFESPEVGTTKVIVKPTDKNQIYLEELSSGKPSTNYILADEWETQGKIEPQRINLTFNSGTTKYYGQTMNFSNGDFTVKSIVGDKNEKPQLPDVGELLLTATSAGADPSASVGTYGVSAYSSSKKYTIFSVDNSLRVEPAVPEGEVASLSCQQGKPISTVAASLNGTFVNPYSGAAVPGTVTWVDGNEKASETVDEAQNYGYKFTPADTKNYTTITGMVKVTATEGPPAPIEIVGGTSLVYNGAEQDIKSKIAKVDGVTYTVTYDEERVPKDVGTYTATINASGSGYSPNEITVNIVIAPATPTVTVTATQVDAGTMLSASNLTANATVEGDVAWDYVGENGPDQVEVVEGTSYSWTFTPADHNYVSVSGVAVPAPKKNEPSGGGGGFGGGGGAAAGGGGGGGGAASTANVSVSKSLQNGSVKVNDSGAEAGDTVKVTPQADAGYMVDQVTVTDKNGKAIEVKKNSDGTYSFVMPEEDRLPVTVTATFKVDPATGGPAAKFTDVNRDAWYRDGINFVLEHNLMQGVSADTFAPNATTTRGMIVTILYRLAGEPAASAGAFADVADGAWYADAIGWAAANGIVQGLSETQFAPNEPVTREQLAAILYRYEQKFGDGGFTGDWSYQLPFEDTAKMSDWAYEAMAWCNMNGVIDGMTAKTLEPAGNATRAQIATILMRFAADEAE